MNPRYGRTPSQSRENPPPPLTFTRTRVSALLFPPFSLSLSLFLLQRAVYDFYSVDYYAIAD